MRKIVLFTRENEIQIQRMDSFGVKNVFDMADLEEFVSDQSTEDKAVLEVFGDIPCPAYLEKHISNFARLNISFASSETLKSYLPLINKKCELFFNWCSLENLESHAVKSGIVSVQNCIGSENFYINSKALELRMPPIERINQSFLESLVSLWVKPTADFENESLKENQCTNTTYSDIAEYTKAVFLVLQCLELSSESFNLLIQSKCHWINFNRCWLIDDLVIDDEKLVNVTTKILNLDVVGLSFNMLNIVLSKFARLESLTTVNCDYYPSTLLRISRMAALKELQIKGDSLVKTGKSVCENIQLLIVTPECKIDPIAMKKCFPRARIEVLD